MRTMVLRTLRSSSATSARGASTLGSGGVTPRKCPRNPLTGDRSTGFSVTLPRFVQGH
jgi:hypothetical protein